LSVVAAAVVAAVVVATVVVAIVVVLVADAVVVLEGLDGVAQVVFDRRAVGRIAGIERSAVLDEPLAGVDVEGDVRGLVGDDEAALELLLGLDRADEAEWLASKVPSMIAEACCFTRSSAPAAVVARSSGCISNSILS